ncbi:MAG: Asp-tRNA(Asn)/Glu-tRNA(Gln) amidotransferase subunit GatC [Microgenomates group bacterium]|jgi:aspartyl-tRNA(Asn)/glutamyl-tRNA(Gln) amidotransferase subunit C
MKLSKDQVKKVAKLANLSLTQDEEDKYAEQLSAILDYIDQLNSAKIQNAEPTFNVTDLSNVLAEDEVKPSLTQDEALKNAPLSKNGFFETKGVFENE